MDLSLLKAAVLLVTAQEPVFGQSMRKFQEAEGVVTFSLTKEALLVTSAPTAMNSVLEIMRVTPMLRVLNETHDIDNPEAKLTELLHINPL